MAENEHKTEEEIEVAGDAAESSDAANAEAEGAHQELLEPEEVTEGVEPEAASPASLEDMAEQLAEARDQVLRAQAEAQNVRRRAEKDVEHARKYALERFAGELLPVVDNLERALEAANAETATMQPVVEGIDLTLKSFVHVLDKFQVVSIDPTGEPFDPQLHQAMTMVPNPDMEPNTVMDTMQKGFTLNGRLVRPAMVIVSKAPE